MEAFAIVNINPRLQAAKEGELLAMLNPVSVKPKLFDTCRRERVVDGGTADTTAL